MPGNPTVTSAEQNKDLVRRYYDEMWNTWNFRAAEELLAEDIVFQGSLGAVTNGRQEFRDYMRQVQSAFPDFHNSIEQLIAEGPAVMARLTYRGTHRGQVLGISPTGKKILYVGVAIFEVREGRIAQGWVLGDRMGLAEQLGGRILPR